MPTPSELWKVRYFVGHNESPDEPAPKSFPLTIALATWLNPDHSFALEFDANLDVKPFRMPDEISAQCLLILDVDQGQKAIHHHHHLNLLFPCIEPDRPNRGTPGEVDM